MGIAQAYRRWRFRRAYPLYGKMVICSSSVVPHLWMRERCDKAEEAPLPPPTYIDCNCGARYMAPSHKHGCPMDGRSLSA